MEVQHPRAVLDDEPRPAHAWSDPAYRRTNYRIDEDGMMTVPDDEAERVMGVLADAYDVAYADDGTVAGAGVCGAELSDGGTCDRPADECPYHDQEG